VERAVYCHVPELDPFIIGVYGVSTTRACFVELMDRGVMLVRVSRFQITVALSGLRV
jgi:hypothetical protein